MRATSLAMGVVGASLVLTACGSGNHIEFGASSGSSGGGEPGASSSVTSSVSSGASTSQTSSGGGSIANGGATASSSSGSIANGGAVASSSTSATVTSSSSTASSSSSGGPCPAFKSCADQAANCGDVPDGCGDILDCGTCPAGETCGAVTANQCGAKCSPLTCAAQGFQCGTASDDCGGTLNCGACPANESCVANHCVSSCTPLTCAAQGFDCGTASDDCGGTLNCGGCAINQSCVLNHCADSCEPLTCAAQGFNCGAATDGCGTTLNCGTCPAGETCGAVNANQCGAGACTGLCMQQTTCPGGGTTSLTGVVYAPNGVDPLSGVTVYVPNAPVPPFTQGVSCESCSSSLASPLVKTTTAANGSFTLTNMPVGANIPIVIQRGRWRRQLTIPAVAACTTNAASTQLSMPSTKAEGDIPLMAFVTGEVDALECLLRKIGIADSEFSDPTGTGRVQLYQGVAGPGAIYSASTPSETTLWGTQAAIDKYDMVYFACQGLESDKTAAEQAVLIDYANAGGRVFLAHYGYVWLDNDAPFSSTATWVADNASFMNDPGTGIIDTSFARGNALAEWLQAIGATTTLGSISVGALRNDFTAVASTSSSWLTVSDPTEGTVPLHYTFDTPVNSAPSNTCGRVAFSDFHVEDSATNTTNMTFPAECTTAVTTMTPEEKMVEYMLFDLDDCIAP